MGTSEDASNAKDPWYARLLLGILTKSGFAALALVGVLLAVGAGIWRGCEWTSTEVIKPLTEDHKKFLAETSVTMQDAQSASRERDKTLATIGQVLDRVVSIQEKQLDILEDNKTKIAVIEQDVKSIKAAQEK